MRSERSGSKRMHVVMLQLFNALTVRLLQLTPSDRSR
jgi:hypothetical protein